MRHYESVIIFDARLNDEQLNAEIDKVRTLLNSQGAQDLDVEDWGRREMAYELQKNKSNQGRYVCFFYTSDEHAIVDALNASLRITDGVALFQTHRLGLPKRKFKGRIQSESDQVEIAI